ncbi:hypothetical protein B0H11DRAFT_1939769 [Mycena galericulata]|nr:hypothetical protein B0H11DRAFT_1939769 [Mycena galericulata]
MPTCIPYFDIGECIWLLQNRPAKKMEGSMAETACPRNEGRVFQVSELFMASSCAAGPSNAGEFQLRTELQARWDVLKTVLPSQNLANPALKFLSLKSLFAAGLTLKTARPHAEAKPDIRHCVSLCSDSPPRDLHASCLARGAPYNADEVQEGHEEYKFHGVDTYMCANDRTYSIPFEGIGTCLELDFTQFGSGLSLVGPSSSSACFRDSEPHTMAGDWWCYAPSWNSLEVPRVISQPSPVLKTSPSTLDASQDAAPAKVQNSIFRVPRCPLHAGFDPQMTPAVRGVQLCSAIVV